MVVGNFRVWLMVVGIFWVVVGLFWLVVGFFVWLWVVVGGGEFILGVGGWW